MSKLHAVGERINLKFKLHAGRNYLAFVSKPNKTPPTILSIKLNGIESCRSRIKPNEVNIPCGQQKIKHKPLITFGQPTYYGQYPWHAAIFELTSIGQFKYICGGTIISQNAVITGLNANYNFKSIINNVMFVITFSRSLCKRLCGYQAT